MLNNHNLSEVDKQKRLARDDVLVADAAADTSLGAALCLSWDIECVTGLDTDPLASDRADQ